MKRQCWLIINENGKATSVCNYEPPVGPLSPGYKIIKVSYRA